jgi:glycosyltransferase involved in cell wall biosynthesis
MKSVCLVVQNSYPSDVRIRKFAQTLCEEGHRVVVLASKMKGQRYHEHVEGVEVFRVPPGKRRAGKLTYLVDYLLFFFFACLQLNILDLRRQFDVIHINTLPDFLVFCAFIQKLSGSTVILDMHEVMPEFFMSKYSVRRRSIVVRALLYIEKVSMKYADQIITVNQSMCDLFEKRVILKKSVKVIMNTVDKRIIKSFEKRAHTGFNCVYHGTLTDIYGIDIAIEGFSNACTILGKEDMKFHIFGTGPNIEELRKHAKKINVEKKIIFHGEIGHKEVWRKLEEMDLGILACRKNIFTNLSFSNKLAEYVFLKIPVIHSDLESIRHYFGENEIIYFKSGNVEELGEKICDALKSGYLIASRADAAFNRYRAIEWGIMSRRYLDIIENCGTNKGINNESKGVNP